MTEDSPDDTGPLPRSWLPPALPAVEDPVWDERVDQIMIAAELQEPTASRVTGAERRGIEMWWAPATAVAAASIALILLVDRPGSLAEAPPSSIPLRLMAAGGDPAVLWNAIGVEADPVLALIAVQEQPASVDATKRAVVPEARHR